VKSWVASFALHGAVFGLATLAWLEPAIPEAAEPLRWEVAFAPAPVTPSPPVTPPPRPEPRREQARPVPEPVAPPPPRQAALPAPAPAPVAPAAPAPVMAQPVVTAQATVELAPVRAPAPPPVQARPVPPPAVDSAAEVERRWYLALLERLRAMKRYPMAARRLGQEGVVLIECRIGPDGRLEGAEVKRGSGYPLLDQDALRLLEAAAETARGQLQPERPTRLEIPIAYRLES
jgi:protein TonB